MSSSNDPEKNYRFSSRLSKIQLCGGEGRELEVIWLDRGNIGCCKSALIEFRLPFILTAQGCNHRMVIILVNLNRGPQNENVAGIRSKDEAE